MRPPFRARPRPHPPQRNACATPAVFGMTTETSDCRSTGLRRWLAITTLCTNVRVCTCSSAQFVIRDAHFVAVGRVSRWNVQNVRVVRLVRIVRLVQIVRVAHVVRYRSKRTPTMENDPTRHCVNPPMLDFVSAAAELRARCGPTRRRSPLAASANSAYALTVVGERGDAERGLRSLPVVGV